MIHPFCFPFLYKNQSLPAGRFYRRLQQLVSGGQVKTCPAVDRDSADQAAGQQPEAEPAGSSAHDTNFHCSLLLPVMDLYQDHAPELVIKMTNVADNRSNHDAKSTGRPDIFFLPKRRLSVSTRSNYYQMPFPCHFHVQCT
jgi:hypothetical protein